MEKRTDRCGLAVSAGRSARARFLPELVPRRSQAAFGCPFKTHKSLICVFRYFANVYYYRNYQRLRDLQQLFTEELEENRISTSARGNVFTTKRSDVELLPVSPLGSTGRGCSGKEEKDVNIPLGSRI